MALVLAALLLALGWLVVTHITNVAADKATTAATKAIEALPDQDPPPPASP